MQKPSLIITKPVEAPQSNPNLVKAKSQAPRLARFICFLFQSVLAGQTLVASSIQFHLRQPVYLVMYIEKLLEITQCPLPTVMLALRYIQKIRADTPDMANLSPKDQLRLFAISNMLAQKYTDDHPYSNKVWSKVIGMPSAELTEGERELLTKLQWTLHLKLEEYAEFCWQIQLLAKMWNQFILKTTSGRRSSGAVPASPMPLNNPPMTPSSSIPIMLNKIDSKLQTVDGVQSAMEYKMSTPTNVLLQVPQSGHPFNQNNLLDAYNQFNTAASQQPRPRINTQFHTVSGGPNVTPLTSIEEDAAMIISPMKRKSIDIGFITPKSPDFKHINSMNQMNDSSLKKMKHLQLQ